MYHVYVRTFTPKPANAIRKVDEIFCLARISTRSGLFVFRLCAISPVSRISQPPLRSTNATTRIRWFTASREEQMFYIGAACSRAQRSVGIVNYMRVIGTINVSRTGCITYAPLSTFRGRNWTRPKTQFGSNIVALSESSFSIKFVSRQRECVHQARLYDSQRLIAYLTFFFIAPYVSSKYMR